jgi:4-amino-4-deoxy-L-arabinose transferase-like glycosyltransferase
MMLVSVKANKHRYGLILALIVIPGGFVRLWGINFGLPHLHHPDEWALAMPALRILQTGDLNPHRFDYGSLYMYLLAGVYGLYFLYGRSRGFFASIHDFPIYEPTHSVYAYEYPGIYLVGRTFTAVLGLLTIVVVYLIGRRLMNRQAGLVAALFLAFFPLHVVNSHYITTDVPVTLLATLSFLFALRTLERGAYRDYALAGLLAGLTASIKYTGGMVIVALVAAHFLRRRQGFESAKLLVGLLTCALGFGIGTPFALLDLQTWREWLEYDRNVYNPPGVMLEGSSARWYLNYLLQPPFVFIALPGILGLIWTLRDGKREGWMVTAVLVVYYGLMSAQKLRWPRALMPMLPFLALLAGFFVVKSATLIHRRWRLRKINRGWLTATLALLLVIVPLRAAVGHAYRLTQKSARTLTREWVVRNLPLGTRIATDLAAPVLPPDLYQVDRVGWSILNHEVSWYRQEGYEYLIISESVRNSINRTVEKEAQYQAFLSDDSLTLIAEIKGHLLSHPDISIWVYQLGE